MITKRKGQNLTGMNTFRMNVSCDLYIEYDSVADLIDIDFETLPKPVLHIGGGSNLLFSGNFRGTVLHSAIKFIYELPEDDPLHTGPDEVLVSVGAGVKFDDFCAWAAENGLWGAENLSHIPGEAGAAAVQNIGAYGVEAKDIIAGVTCFDIEKKEKTAFKVDECRYGYRDSIFKSEGFKSRYIVTGVLFRLSRKALPKIEYGALKSVFADGVPENPMQVREAVIKIRDSKLPSPDRTGSAGSFFKNPIVSPADFARICEGYESVPHYLLPGGFIKVPAAWLIEQCGLKGQANGGAAVYEKQPLVIVNRSGEASPEDVIGLERRIVETVKEKFGVELHPEVEHI